MAISKFLRNAFGDTFRVMNITESDLEDAQYELVLPKLDRNIETQLASSDGLIIEGGLKNNDIKLSIPNQYFLFKSRPVLVYIRDQYLWESEYYTNKFNAFHICFCNRLEERQKEHRFKERYVLTYNTTGVFLVNFVIRERLSSGRISIIEKKENQHEHLNICQNCLYKLNWKNFRSLTDSPDNWGHSRERAKAVQKFSIQEFLRTARKETFKPLGLQWAANATKKEYILSPEEKDLLKKNAKYRCRKCGKFFSSKDLYIHHIEHNEGNNPYDNLMVVCMPCHKKIHRMEGGYILDD